MKCEAKIKVFDNPNTLYRVFATELRPGKSNRSSVKIKKGKKYLEFDFKAEDPTALRAAINSITRLLTVYEKMGKLK